MRDTAEECIYNLIPREERAKVKDPLYTSKFKAASAVPPKKKKPAATFGPLKVKANTPSTFIKKHEKDAMRKLPPPSKFVRTNGTRKPPVPKKTEKPAMGRKTDKDFVRSNVMDSTVIKSPQEELEEMDYLKKPDFGKVPEYLADVKKDIKDERKMQADEQRRAEGIPTTRELSQKEKEDMIRGLREQWNAISANYRKLPVALNTLSQVARKEEMEKQMVVIEKDIERLSKQHVFVQTDLDSY